MSINDVEPAAPEIIVKQPDLTFWTEARFERAKKMFIDGSSYTDIGIALGTTRNAICGKLVRNGVFRVGKRVVGETRTYSKRGAYWKQQNRAERKARRQELDFEKRYNQGSREPWVRPELPPLNLETAVSFDDLQLHHCRWPHGEDGTTLYCGAERFNNLLPYCAPHCRIAYVPPNSRR